MTIKIVVFFVAIQGRVCGLEISRNLKQRLAQLLILLMLANPGLAAASAADSADPITFTVDKTTAETTGEKAASSDAASDSSASGKRISDQEKLNSFGNRLLAYYLQRGQKGGPSWLKTTDIQLRFDQDNRPLYSFETVQPFGEVGKDGSLWFWQGRYAHLSADNGSTANLGFGWRKLSSDKTSLVGLNLFYDYGFQYDLQRVGFGAEYFHKQMEYRFNYYRPLSGEKQTGQEYQSSGILYSYIRAVEGFDYELGTSLPKAPWWKVYAGGYHWDNEHNPDENGFRLRSNMQLTPRVAVEIGYQSSNLASGNLYGKISYQLADALGPAFWGSLPTIDGKPIPVLVQLYQNGKPIGEPILVNAAKLTDRFTAKATPVNPSDLALRSANDVSHKMLQKVERENDIKTEKWTKFVAYTGSIAVSVTNTSGGALQGVSLQAYQNGNAVGTAVTSDASGKGTISGLTVGSYTVKATYFNLSADSSAVTVVKDQTAQAAITLSITGGGITVTVTDASGNPIAGAIVTIQSSGSSAQGEKNFFDLLFGVKTAYAAVSSYSITRTTGAAGTASFGNLPAGSYIFTAASGTQTITSSTVTVPTGGGNLTSYVVMSGSGAGGAAIKVTDGTNVISGATVSVTVGSVIQSVVTDPGGVAVLGNLPTGTQTFTASKTGYPTMTAGVTIASGATATATIALTNQIGNASFTITDTGGNALNAVVTQSPSGTTKTAVSGVATFTGLTVGTYDFAVALDGYVSKTLSVTIAGGTTTPVAVALARQSGTVTITVYPSGSSTPLTTATVSLAVGSAVQTTTTTSGVATFTGIPVGNYNFTASATGYVTSGGTDTVAVTSSGGSASVKLSAESYIFYSSASTGGTISPSGSTTCTSEGSVTYTIAHTGNYYFSGLVVNGVITAAATTEYDGCIKTFSKPTANTSVSAIFSPFPTIYLYNKDSINLGIDIWDDTIASKLTTISYMNAGTFHALPGHTIRLVSQATSLDVTTFIMPIYNAQFELANGKLNPL